VNEVSRSALGYPALFVTLPYEIRTVIARLEKDP